MALAHIFYRRIDRPIEGVIKADDKASLYLEVDEYELTTEVGKRLEAFLSAYTQYTGANGVWISGFFGSGKSHLLKMLALLMENQVIGDTSALNLFLPKCGDNEILRGDLKKAVAIPAKSILFNIDQKADVISKSQIDALLAVFVKVFDDMCGYYGKHGHIAQFERDLDSRGQYEPFKQAYQAIAKREWKVGREQALLEGHHIAAAYAQVTGTPPSGAQGILDKYRAQYKVSIEDFADQVQAYITQQGPDFRLNFFVDEVGQYIADNVKLMTNLQTIAESLATKCRGRAWIIVTAQEDMSDIVGEMSQQQGNDFSKIQARFANRMKLTSADVAEVIGRRLLLKNDQGIELLTDLYAAQQNNFKTLFTFADGAQNYRNFRDRDDFIRNYPFVPYQFVLFQMAIKNLSLHNAFEGKHRSVGERSMLEVFQHVAKQISQHQIGQLATFDLMFEGIRATLKAQIQGAVLTAERHLDNPFATKVLKALFLVKYVKEFKATLRNLTVLMLDRFDTDLPALRKRIEEALNLLEQQTYIQRNGEEYAYLTNEEKDVEQEIKNTEVEASVVADELEKLIFDQVIKDRKIRYDENKQDYPFARKLDDRLLGREYELAIHVISPFHEHTGNETILRAQAMGRDELLVIMPPSHRLMSDLVLYKQTEKYIRLNISATQQESIKRILTDKGFQNAERLGLLRKLAPELLSKATLIVGGRDVAASGSEAPTRIIRGFYELLEATYPNLRMLRGLSYTEHDIAACLRSELTLLGDDSATFSEAEQEMLAFIQSNQRTGLRTTMQSLVNRFERKPYGWYLAAIQCIAAKLLVRGKVELRRDGALLEGPEVERALRNTHGFGMLLLEPQIDFTPLQVRQLKEFYADFFNGPPLANEAKALGQETAAAFNRLTQELAARRSQTTGYPFYTALSEAVTRLEGLTGKPYAFYLTDLHKQADALLDLKEGLLDPVTRFLSGSQKQIYDEAQQFLSAQEPNFAYLQGDEAQQLPRLLAEPACYQGNQMNQVKTLLDDLKRKVNALLAGEKALTVKTIESRWARLTGMAEYHELTAEQQAQLRRPFDELLRTLERYPLIAVIRDHLRRFDDDAYQQQLRKMTAWAQPTPVLPPLLPPGNNGHAPNGGNGGGMVKVIAEPPVEYVVQRNLAIPFAKAWLADEQDVDTYLSALRAALLTEIRAGKRVQL